MGTHMKKHIITAIAAIIPFIVSGQTTKEDMERIRKEAQIDMDSAVADFEAEADAALEAYLETERQLREEYEAFKKEVMGIWGDNEVVESTRKEWVEYGADKSSRTMVDFETGKVAIEVLTDPSDTEADIRAKLENAVNGLLTSRGKTCDFDSKVLPQHSLSDKPLLDSQLNLSRYESGHTAPGPTMGGNSGTAPKPGRNSSLNLSRHSSVSNRTAPAPARPAPAPAKKTSGGTMADRAINAKSLAQVIVATEKPTVQTVQTNEGKKNVVTITMELVEDHIPKRAEQFKGMISRHSKKFTVDEPLIYAIMEQESAFNPAAQSWVPAYGLMQLVPKSGGRDAYRYVHKEDKIPSANFLFDPENNIELGTGYLKLLMSTTFSKVTDPQCRMLCAIAAYNTGAGNVSRAINGTTNISKAIPTINTMTYSQLFSHLKRALPHAETQDYIQKVTSKMEKYKK